MTEGAEDRPKARGADRIIGEVLASRYRIEARLGEGAMGTVYRATHVKVGRAFAVKVLHPSLLEDAKLAQRFEREAELAGRLRHPNVVGVVDVGETEDGLRYMVMDFAHGPDLASLLSEAPMPAARIVNLARQLLEGLYHAHEAGLIHRDFKPENVIVEKDAHGVEVPRIVDFGIAILREGGSGPDGQGRLTTNGLVLGTPHYMAPEQAVADPIDHRIDLFALGIVIYELLCGKLPFDGSGAEVARANLLLDPPPIAERVPYLEVDPLLEAFARRLLAKKRDARPATAKAARELLDLIDKDRDAAAIALGVPHGTSREPAVTAPSAPQPRRTGNANDTFPPPVAPAPVDDQRAIETDLVPSASGLRNSRTPLILAIGGALVAGIVAIVFATRSTEPAAAPPADMPVDVPIAPPVALAPEPAAPLTAPAITPIDAAVETVVADASIASPPTRPPSTKPRPAKPPIATTKSEPPVTKPEPVVPVAPPDPAPATLGANQVAALYGAIGKRLGALGADADPNWWVLYRRIKINEAMKDPAKLAEAQQLLAKIQRELAARDAR